MGYSSLIVESVSAVDRGVGPRDAEQIEEVMRTQRPTLDGLDKRQFTRLARDAWEAVKLLREDGVYETP